VANTGGALKGLGIVSGNSIHVRIPCPSKDCMGVYVLWCKLDTHLNQEKGNTGKTTTTKMFRKEGTRPKVQTAYRILRAQRKKEGSTDRLIGASNRNVRD